MSKYSSGSRAHTSIDIFDTDANHVLQIPSKENKNYYLLGDFNIDHLKDKLIDLKVIFFRFNNSYYNLKVTVAKRHMRSPMFTASFILVSRVKLP